LLDFIDEITIEVLIWANSMWHYLVSNSHAQHWTCDGVEQVALDHFRIFARQIFYFEILYNFVLKYQLMETRQPAISPEESTLQLL
jgi:hypothetical protein